MAGWTCQQFVFRLRIIHTCQRIVVLIFLLSVKHVGDRTIKCIRLVIYSACI